MPGKQKTERLQVPISKDKKEALDLMSEQLGFGSTTDTVRFLINNLINGSIDISINNVPVGYFNEETKKEVLESRKDVAAGKVVELDPGDKDFFEKLDAFANE